MKLTIEVEVSNHTVEDAQAFAYAENEYGMYEDAATVKVDQIDAVEVFIAMWGSGKIDYTVTKAEMTDKRCEHAEYKDGYCAEMICKNYYVIGRNNDA
jgi:hypothetical protein